MFERLLGLEKGQKVIDMDVILHSSYILLAIFILGAVVYTFFHYRSVRKIPSSGRKLTGLFHILAPKPQTPNPKPQTPQYAI